MKELEKIAPKQKGIVPQSVKEVTQILVDEGLVECEKIGTLMCFWAFPSKASQCRKRRIDELDKKIAETESRISSLKTNVAEARIGKEDSSERTELFSRFTSIKSTLSHLQEKRTRLSATGPEAIACAQTNMRHARDGVNRWTDNIFSVKKWCKKKFGMEEKMLNTQFGIDPELDYVD